MPAVAVIVMAVCKCPSIPTLMVSTLVAVVLAMLVQGQTLSGILNILDSGFSIDTALPEFNRLVNRGGLQSMLWTAALGILGMLYGSIMEKTGLLEALLSKMDPLVKSTGGLVTAVFDGKKVWYVKQEIKNDLRFVAIVPDFELSTAKARGVLPDTVPRRDGVFNLSRAALMSVSLYSGNYHNLRVAADDRLHQPYRMGLVKGGGEVMDACFQLGAYAAYLSGAGPTIMAIVDANLRDFGDCIARRLPELGLDGWQVHTLSIDNAGTVIERV